MSFGKMNVNISIAEETIVKDAEGFATKTDTILASLHAYREGRHGSQNGSIVPLSLKRRIYFGSV